MSTFLSETLGVADSGVFWDVGNIKLWQSTQRNVVLFTTKQPELVKGPNGRYELAVSSYSQQQPDRSYKITGGSAIFTITSALQYDPKALQDAQDSWRAAMGADGGRVKFVPLNTRKAEATVLVNPLSGTPDQAHNDKDIGTPGGTNSFLVELTELGAQEWVQGIKNKTAIPAGVKIVYEYLRMLPPVGAVVTVHGSRVFQHLSAALDVSYDGFWYGGSAKIEAAWEDMRRSGDIEITFVGGDLPADLEKLRQELTTTFAQQAREIFFNQIFAPKPDVKPAQPGSTSGIYGGANFALKWKKESDAIDLSQTIKFEGMTWLKASMDTSLAHLFANLDDSYVTEVQTQQSFPASIVVDPDEMLSDVAISMAFSEGHSPEAPVFSKTGGNERYIVVSQHPNNVTISYDAKINYASPRWPIVETKGSATVANGGNQAVIKAGQWVGRHEIYMFVRDGNRILPPSELSENDSLVLNVRYSAPHLSTPVQDSAHLSGLGMVEFAYPLDPQGRPGEAKFNAFGVIGGKLVRSADQVIDPSETAVFILATTDGKIQLVSKNSVLPEDDELAQRLLEASARPVLISDTSPASETEKSNGKVNGLTEIEGMIIALEYGSNGPVLWVEKSTGGKQPIRLHTIAESYPFENSRKHVRVKTDAAGYAKSILVELTS